MKEKSSDISTGNKNSYYTRVLNCDGDHELPTMQYFCYTPSPYQSDELLQYEMICVFKNGVCEHHKALKGKTLEITLKREDIEWADSDIACEVICTKHEFDAIKSVVLKLCKTNAVYLIPEMHRVDSWD